MSQRLSISENINDSKNTRLSIQDLAVGDARPDVLAHLSRYSKIAKLFLDESKRLGRPIQVLDIGCGELWALKVLYKAHVCKKAEVIQGYLGIDIDEKMLDKTRDKSASMLNLFEGIVIQQDVTVNPVFPLADNSVDFVYSTEVIEHMKPEFVRPWLNDISRALRPGGLVYISTPNHDGSNDKLPADHVYEWSYQELKDVLEERWELKQHTGTFIQLNNFKRAQAELGYFGEEVLEALKSRFDTFWLRNVLAAPYPSYANNVAWILRNSK